MRSYELTAIVNPEITEEDVPQAIEKLTALIAQKGGNVIGTNRLGRRRLAYPIRHYGEGNYLVTEFEFDPGKLGDLESSLRLSDSLLRHLLVKLSD